MQLATTRGRKYIMEALRENAEPEDNPSSADNFQLFAQEVSKRIAQSLGIPLDVLIGADTQKTHPQT